MRTECQALPKGWKREEIIRKSGLSAGKTEVCYYSPDGHKFRSKPQMARYLGRAYDLSAFDFRSGKIIQSALRRTKKTRTGYDFSTGMRNDPNISLPIRQTASIFKQPVTVIKGRDGSAKDAPDSSKATTGPKDKPRQLFWERRFGTLKASSPDDSEEGDERVEFQLPNAIQDCGLKLPAESLVRSIAAALHTSSRGVIGQSEPHSVIEAKPGARVCPEQPYVKYMQVSERDIAWQEHKVRETRRRLQQQLSVLEKVSA